MTRSSTFVRTAGALVFVLSAALPVAAQGDDPAVIRPAEPDFTISALPTSLRLPTFGTRLDMRNRDFFNRIGVRAVETFAPGDMELEPEFDVVAEWRDFRTTSGLRLQDVLMDKLFEWMDLHDYRFRETLVIRLISLFGRLASHLSDEAKELLTDVVPKVPINMRRRTIATVAMLHKTAEPLFDELRRLEAEAIARTGRQLHPREVREILERVRQRMGREIGYLVAKA